MWTLSPIHTGRIKASVFEVDPKVLSRNAPESIGESKHFTIASSLRGEVTTTRKIGPCACRKFGAAQGSIVFFQMNRKGRWACGPSLNLVNQIRCDAHVREHSSD